MSMFADIGLNPFGIVAWVIMGVVAGTLAGYMLKRSGYVTKGRGYGALGNMVIGLLGAVLGGVLFGLLVGGTVGFWGSIAVAFFVGCALVLVMQSMTLGRTNP